MNRVFVSFPIPDFHKIKLQVLHWAARFNTCCFLDNHEYKTDGPSYECLLGAGALKVIKANAGNAFGQLKHFASSGNDWLFGHFGFDLKNETEQLSSSHPDYIQFPDLFFFVPEVVIELDSHKISIGVLDSSHPDIFEEISRMIPASDGPSKKPVHIRSRFSQEEYIQTVEKLRGHILYGDCYEINFCQEFFSENGVLNPVDTYQLLSDISPMPFGAFYRMDDKYLFCASPERYLKKIDAKLLTQPIKGTWPRNKADSGLDEAYKEALFYSKKDRSENVMVVDLVRNDLSKVCLPGSVTVNELYGIYTFPQVHQMISTVSGTADPRNDWVDIIAATFPMGSMTGAPKKKVLELIERYEKTKRGLFSGAVGYVTPGRDFDFNVVIRSILYNQQQQYISYQTGSGITFYSDAQNEFEECMLKAEAIKAVLENKNIE